MADPTSRAPRGQRTLCLPIPEDDHARIIEDPKLSRRALDDLFRTAPELFPLDFGGGYQLEEAPTSARPRIRIRRIILNDGTAYSVRPAFLMPYLTARTADVEARWSSASSASPSGPWPASSAATRCCPTAWS